MDKIFRSRILYIIPVVFLVVIAFRIIYSYQTAKREAYIFAKKEAEVLNSHAMHIETIIKICLYLKFYS